MITSGEQIWRAALNELQLVLTPENYNTWLRDTRVVSDEDNTLTIGVPKAFHKDWLENKLNGRITSTMQRLGYGHHAVRYVVVADTPARPVPMPEAPAPRRSREGASAMPLFDQSQPSLSPDYVFETFIVGTSNRLSHAAALAVAADPGEQWNPLFIWGGVGLGKTHLLHAIGHRVRQNFPDKTVVYATCERFTNDMIQAIQRNQNAEFRDRYRTVDVLLIDDIQFLAGREGTQDEFFHTFNELHQARKQIVLTSDRKPNAMSTLEERLRSRFEWGLITDVDMPDLETRVAILRAKAEKQKVPVHPAAIEYIARRAGQSNIRELEGTLKRVIAMALLHQVPVTDKLAAEALDSLAPSYKRKVTATEVLNIVAQYYKLDLEVLKGPARDKGIALPRQVAMYLMREESDASLPGIGALLGNRDHSTIMHGCDKINRELKNENPQLRSDIRAIRAMLYEVK
ncbi:MAG TPA: chromosomal replication initiator protein DnaA [Chloroflexota bacterium]|nr:chromosomal replication initiator protein DnaA [Chloroflexota bacterium]